MPTWVRRTIIGLLLAVAAVSVFGLTRLEGDSSSPAETVIERVTPDKNDKTLQQGRLTVDLLSGWDGSLVIDGRKIPEDQLDKVREQGTISYQPGQGKELEYFPAGENCVTLTYWQIATGPGKSFDRTWCFTSV